MEKNMVKNKEPNFVYVHNLIFLKMRMNHNLKILKTTQETRIAKETINKE